MYEGEYQSIVASLPTMTKAQLTDLRRQILFFIDNKESGGIENRDWLLDGIVAVLRERGVGHMIPANFRVRKASSYAGYETQADRVRMVLTQAIPNMTVTQQQSIGVIAARALADYISGWSEVTFDSLLRNVAKIPESLDAAFPGYLDSGMLPFLIKDRRVDINQ